MRYSFFNTYPRAQETAFRKDNERHRDTTTVLWHHAVERVATFVRENFAVGGIHVDVVCSTPRRTRNSLAQGLWHINTESLVSRRRFPTATALGF